MKYTFSKEVKDNDTLRASFNELTRQTFGFDFEDWYQSGHWGDLYIPHVLLDGDKVISNVSLNLMQFDVQGTVKNYIQLGTVMTDEAYRGQGLNREIMERILEEYAGKVDGIYLFGNDEVLEYYPKFGFRPSKEYEYYLPGKGNAAKTPYVLEKIDTADMVQCEKFYDAIRSFAAGASNELHPHTSNCRNGNDDLYMSENLGLYQFWLAAGYGDHLYYLPEVKAYVIAEADGELLRVHQVFGEKQVDMVRLAKAFGEAVEEVVLGYTPVQKEAFSVREHKEEDCTLFILGEDLKCMEREKRMFPVLSHA